MHELSLSSAIVNTAVKHAAGRKVTSIDLRVGALRQVIPDSLQFYFEFVARDSLCEGAELRLEHVPAVLRCEPCDHTWPVEIPAFFCPRCGGSQVHVESGEEFEIESIEVIEEEVAA